MENSLLFHSHRLSRTAARLLFKALLAEQQESPGPFLFTIISVVIGIAVVVGVEIANQSALAEFERASSLNSGLATHRIVGGTFGLDEQMFAQIKLKAGLRNATPIVQSAVRINGNPETFQLIGIDPLNDFRVRGNGLLRIPYSQLSDTSWPIYVSDLEVWPIGTALTLHYNSRIQEFIVAGSIRSKTNETSSFDNLLITDIVWAQEFLAQSGKLSHIDLQIHSNAEIDKISSVLHPTARLVDMEARNNSQVEMTRAFRTNLKALSLLTLLVAAFLIYSSVSFQIARRRILLSQLRAVGFTAREITRTLCIEIGIIALTGSAVGILLGIFLAFGILELITATVDALYFELDRGPLEVAFDTIVHALLLGFAGTAIAGGVPLWEASRVTVQDLSRRSNEEKAMKKFSRLILPIAVMCMLLGSMILLFPSFSLEIAFVGLFLLSIGMAACVPWLVGQTCKFLLLVTGKVFDLNAKMAIRNIHSHLSRTGVAIAALSMAVCTSLGVAVMIDSFRFSVDRWVNNYLRADVYISSAVADAPFLSLDFQSDLGKIKGVQAIGFSRRLSVHSEFGMHDMLAINTDNLGFKAFMIKQPQKANLWKSFNDPQAVLISESLANHHRLAVGNEIVLPTSSGPIGFVVVGIYYDYTSEHGVVTMAWKNYAQHFTDTRVSSAGVYLEQGASINDVDGQIRRLDSAPSKIFIRSNSELRSVTLSIFDRTFRVTEVLRWLTLFVAIAGLAFSLITLQIERTKLNSTLMAIGFNHSKLAVQILAECSVTGLFVGLFAIPIGLILAFSLMDVINVRSFGWTVSKLVDPLLLMQAVLMSVAAAAISSVYPIIRMWKTPILAGLNHD